MTTALAPQTQALTASATPTLADYVERWLAELDASPTTKQGYRAGIRAYMRFLESEGLTGAQRGDIVAYKGHLQATYAPGTVSTRLTPVRGLYGYLHAVTGAPNIAEGVRGAKATHGHRKDALSPSQVQALLKATGNARDYALVLLMVSTGLRTIEVARAQVGDLRTMAGKTVLDVWGKGRESKDALVIVTPPVEAAIRAYLKERGALEDTAPLFASTSNRNVGGPMTTRSISRLVKEHLVSAGLSSSRLTAHSLRHTAVTLALLGGATLQEAQAMARHANIATTTVYAHNIERLQGHGEAAVTGFLQAEGVAL